MLHFFLLLLFVAIAHSAQPCTDQVIESIACKSQTESSIHNVALYYFSRWKPYLSWKTGHQILLSLVNTTSVLFPFQPHFNYKCTQLMKYCEQPQAMRIRKSCPLSCGMCRPNSAERLESGLLSAPPIFHQFNRAIKRESLSKAQVPVSAVISETFFNRPTPLLPKGKSFSLAVPEVFVTTEEILTDGQS